eukprot:scaffold201_cov405-Prasinococcus_capsulatus_cf.AAC.25
MRDAPARAAAAAAAAPPTRMRPGPCAAELAAREPHLPPPPPEGLAGPGGRGPRGRSTGSHGTRPTPPGLRGVGRSLAAPVRWNLLSTMPPPPPQAIDRPTDRSMHAERWCAAAPRGAERRRPPPGRVPRAGGPDRRTSRGRQLASGQRTGRTEPLRRRLGRPRAAGGAAAANAERHPPPLRRGLYIALRAPASHRQTATGTPGRRTSRLRAWLTDLKDEVGAASSARCNASATMSAIELAFNQLAFKLEEVYALLTLKRRADKLKRLPKDPAKAFCYDMLNRVSRSFAIVIQQLDTELRDAVCVFYLVLRALDTVRATNTFSRHQRDVCFTCSSHPWPALHRLRTICR